jgi:hypothetical protein
MDTKFIVESVGKRKRVKIKKGGTPKFEPTVGFGSRKFIGAYTPGRAYGPAFPMGFGWGEMSSVPGGACGDGSPAGDASGAMEAAEGVKNEDEDLMISDKDKLIYALRGIIENAKVAYEAVTGLPYDEKDDVTEKDDGAEENGEESDENKNEETDDDGPADEGSDDN